MLRGRFFSRFRRQLSERIPALLPTLYPVTDNDSAHSAHSVSWNSLPPVYTVCLVLPGFAWLPNIARASEALGKRGSACISESISCNMYAMLEAKRSSSHAMSAQSSVY